MVTIVKDANNFAANFTIIFSPLAVTIPRIFDWLLIQGIEVLTNHDVEVTLTLLIGKEIALIL